MFFPEEKEVENELMKTIFHFPKQKALFTYMETEISR